MEIQFGLTVRFYYDKERSHFKKSLYFKLLAHFDDGGTNKVTYKSLHPLIEKHWSGTTGHLL